ncbi:hypothetical protein HFP15_29525 [Amycolatopsis sp. K13G38]|uniref:Uncharacterized protein n=1 Tax=Amycolatopsis acididurans TaxID=2724524 RepID=A0ABX1JB49_9PSEU|nr:hypothetical protein [Amycolatopsis acididurans]NKQ57017.1 hypothetical protein [Amycolatopsis acididurans]
MDHLDRCDGTLIQHEDTFVECTDPDCTDLDLVRHRLTISCEEIDGGCACTATLEIEEYAQAC